MTAAPTFIFNTERTAAVRMALGIALSHVETAKLSNAALARAIGCGETTVRRYRKIASAAGLVGLVKAGPAPVDRVPESMEGATAGLLYGAFDAAADATSSFGNKLYARAEALRDMLDQAQTEEEVRCVYRAALELSADINTLDGRDYE